jgi:hypothetical protein
MKSKAKKKKNVRKIISSGIQRKESSYGEEVLYNSGNIYVLISKQDFSELVTGSANSNFITKK